MTSVDYLAARDRSRRERVPAVRYRTDPLHRQMDRMAFGTPVDHPSNRQLRAEAEALEEEWQARKTQRPPRKRDGRSSDRVRPA
jgi:hypothetical protein